VTILVGVLVAVAVGVAVGKAWSPKATVTVAPADKGTAQTSGVVEMG